MPPPEVQIAAAVLPLPAELREAAAVRGYRADAAELVPLRAGSNDMICLADEPGNEVFHVACYHASLEPFMARGRALRAQGMERAAVDTVRFAEAESGALTLPAEPAALYSLTAPIADYDPAANSIRQAQPLYVLYTPWATAESLGLTTKYTPGMPWVMSSGLPSSHIMIVPAKQDVPPDSSGLNRR
ncbi:MAG: hypothetical protein ACRELD_12155 [Longimicrobiales bacterium]